MSDFLKKVQEFDGIISYAASRSEIPGVLEQSDLYQEGLMVLDKVFRQNEFHPDSDDFRKVFKTNLWWHLNHLIQSQKSSVRDWRARISTNQSYDGDGYDLLDIIPSEYVRPDQVFDFKVGLDRVNAILNDLNDQLDDDGRTLLSELLEPTPTPPEYLEGYKRVPTHRSISILCRKLGWTYGRTRRVMSNLKSLAKSILTDHGVAYSL